MAEKYLTYSESVSRIYGGVNYLNFAGNVYYLPANDVIVGEYSDHVEYYGALYFREKDNTRAISGVTDSSGTLTLRLRNEIVQNKTTNNNWYPAATCYKTYSQLNNANVCLPIGYQQNITINPYAGKLKAMDFIVISGSTEISLLNKLYPQPSTYTINLTSISRAEISASGNLVYFSNLVMTLTTDYGSCTWNLGTKSGTGTEVYVTNISASRSTLTCSSSYTPRLSFSGTVCGKSLSNYQAIYVSEVSLTHFDIISPGNSYALINANGHIPLDSSNVAIDFIESM